jgi:hypothetical protein
LGVTPNRSNLAEFRVFSRSGAGLGYVWYLTSSRRFSPYQNAPETAVFLLGIFVVMLVWAGEWGASETPDITLLVVVIALFGVITANTAILASKDKAYHWWYGLVKVAFYFGSFALALSTGGASAAIASVSTFLGMELNRLAQLLHIHGLSPLLGNGRRACKTPSECQDTAER